MRFQEQEFEKAVETEEKRLEKAILRYGADSEEAKAVRGICNLRRIGLAARKKRREDVREAKRALGKCYHPVNLETGQLKSEDQVELELNTNFKVIERVSQEAELSRNSLKRIQKAMGMVGAMISYLRFFFLLLAKTMESLKLTEQEMVFFREVLIPLAYLEEVARKQSGKKRKEMLELLQKLHARARAGPWTLEEIEQRMIEAKKIANLFQRSSSCVEGRNGVLSLKHHGFHKISKRTLNVLTVLHNYHVKRKDGTTAAGRFFGKESDDLFEHILETVPMLGQPRTRVKKQRKHRVAA